VRGAISNGCPYRDLIVRFTEWVAFENQVLVDEFFHPIQPLGINDLQERTERPFLNAAG